MSEIKFLILNYSTSFFYLYDGA